MIKVMIVEDEVIERKALQFLFEKYFNEKIEVVANLSNGQKAIEFEEENQVDLILMDIHMPVLDGIEASRIISNRNTEVQIIILTAHSEFEYARKAIDIGVFKYLLKPIDNDEFISAINDVIQKIKSQSRISERPDEVEWVKRDRNMKFIDEMKTYILENFTKEISIEQVAEHVGLNPDYLGKLFKKVEGQTFTDFIIYLRMELAKELLNQRELTIKQIAYMVGYSDPNYFSRAFKKYVGISATQYEKVNKEVKR